MESNNPEINHSENCFADTKKAVLRLVVQAAEPFDNQIQSVDRALRRVEEAREKHITGDEACQRLGDALELLRIRMDRLRNQVDRAMEVLEA